MESLHWHKQIVLSSVLTMSVIVPPLSADTGLDIIEKTGVQGGLVVHLGCGNGQLTADLRRNDRYLVQGLDTDAAAGWGP